MGILEFGFVQDFIRLCSDGDAMGFHERNGGNLSYRLTSQDEQDIQPYITFDKPWVDMGIEAPNVGHRYFLVTGSGKFMHNVARLPQECIGIVQLSKDGSAYRIVWGFEKGAKPTSEIFTHILNHSAIKEKDEANRIIYHLHPENVIALSFILPLEDEVFSKTLWRSMTECPVIFPEGIGVVEWMVPGGYEIALKTSEKMKEYQAVIWAHHGLFVSGDDFDSAFGLAHTIEKSASIYCTILSTQKPILNTITDEDLHKIEPAFHIQLNPKFFKD